MATLSNQAIKGMKKIGNVILPGNKEFPSYSEAAGTHKLNDLVQYAPEDDIQSLNLLLIILSFMPLFVHRWIVKKMKESTESGKEGLLPTTFRQLDLGLRGLLYSTYYGEFINPNYKGKTPMEIIDYVPTRIPN
ncbi:MAG: hypothetical protein LC105_00760 [Chitinophagales bacterium]|nr:hypothetical protein [Chitinophagales bacterium]MCZ2392376.1 hypothetical protein [Chitinophagales bacterium]